MGIKKRRYKKPSVNEIILGKVATFIKTKRLIPKDTRNDLDTLLYKTKQNKTPEQFFAEIFLVCVYSLLPLIITLFFIPFLSIAVLFIIIFVVSSKYNEPQKIDIKFKKEITKTLPKFIDYISNSLKDSRDIYFIFKSYSPNAPTYLSSELKQTILEIDTLGLERALLNMSNRIGHPDFTECLFSLIGISRGDTNIEYFQILSIEFRKKYWSELKLRALKKPSGINKFSLILLFCFILTYFSIFGVFIFKTVSNAF